MELNDWRTLHSTETWKLYWCSQDQRHIPSHSNQCYNCRMYAKQEIHSYSESHILCGASVSHLGGFVKAPGSPATVLFSVELPRWKLICGCYINTDCKHMETHHIATSPLLHTPLMKWDPCSQLEQKGSGSHAGELMGSGCLDGETHRAHLRCIMKSHRGACLHSSLWTQLKCELCFAGDYHVVTGSPDSISSEV